MIFVAFILNEVINMSENSKNNNVKSQIIKLQNQIKTKTSISVKDACDVFNALYKENKSWFRSTYKDTIDKFRKEGITKGKDFAQSVLLASITHQQTGTFKTIYENLTAPLVTWTFPKKKIKPHWEFKANDNIIWIELESKGNNRNNSNAHPVRPTGSPPKKQAPPPTTQLKERDLEIAYIRAERLFLELGGLKKDHVSVLEKVAKNHQYISYDDALKYICALNCPSKNIDGDEYGDFDPFKVHTDMIKYLTPSQQNMVETAAVIKKLKDAKDDKPLYWLNSLMENFTGTQYAFIQPPCPFVLNIQKGGPSYIELYVGPKGYIVEKNSTLKAIRKFIDDMKWQGQDAKAMISLKTCLDVFKTRGINVDYIKTKKFLQENELGELGQL